MKPVSENPDEERLWIRLDKLSQVKVTVASIAGRARSEHFDALAAEYVSRMAAYAPTEAVVFRTSGAFFEWVEKQRSRRGSVLVLLDGRGKLFSSEELAGWLRRQRDEGQQRVVFAIGPADGWSDEERARAGLLLSLGPMTLAHELARVVLSEQIYRAFTILAGHPYHRGS
jgi:23S rRNA (pseudouridine1915-N3)-methyltransferase